MSDTKPKTPEEWASAVGKSLGKYLVKCLFFIIFGWILQYGWNRSCPELFNLPRVSLSHALALMLVVSVLGFIFRGKP